MKVVHREAYPPESVEGGIHRLGFAGLNTRIVSCEKGCVIARHGHERAEEIYVISGRVRLNEHILEPGDLLRTEAGEFHEAEALEESRFLVANTAEPRA